jgi:putative NIF3 family GTP cyclohydrolase 1 type 2
MGVTVQDVIQALKEPVHLIERTVDTLKSGDPGMTVSGIAVTMTATYSVIKRSMELGANLIITHEPTFYNHLDESVWLENDDVYRSKRRLIEESGIAIFRFHDYMHAYEPDAILSGMLKALEWDVFSDPVHPWLLTMPAVTVRDIAEHIKRKLGVSHLRAVGDLSQECRKIGLLPGAAGGERQIGMLSKDQIDLLVVGETHEWETNEYVRDAAEAGERKALLILGHQKSEEAAMRHFAGRLEKMLPDVPVTFIESETAYQTI